MRRSSRVPVRKKSTSPTPRKRGCPKTPRGEEESSLNDENKSTSSTTQKRGCPETPRRQEESSHNDATPTSSFRALSMSSAAVRKRNSRNRLNTAGSNSSVENTSPTKGQPVRALSMTPSAVRQRNCRKNRSDAADTSISGKQEKNARTRGCPSASDIQTPAQKPTAEPNLPLRRSSRLSDRKPARSPQRVLPANDTRESALKRACEVPLVSIDSDDDMELLVSPTLRADSAAPLSMSADAVRSRQARKRKKETKDSAKSTPRTKKFRRSRKPQSIHPAWYKGPSDVGKLSKRCPFCLALHFKKEKFRCCNKGVVKMNEPREPPPIVRELLDGKTERARKHQAELCKLNTLYSFAAKQCTMETVPGRGVPITKVRGGYTHTTSTVRPAPNSKTIPSFGGLYAYDLQTQTEKRIDNERLSKDCDANLLAELAEEFEHHNILARQYKHMGHVLEEEEQNNGGVLPSMFMRLVPREEAMNNPAAKKLMENDHKGRYNMPDQTMVMFVFKTDDDGVALLPKGVNVYPYHNGGPGTQIPFFSELINPLCYPFIHPYGIVDFKNNTIDLIEKPVKLSKEEIADLTRDDVSDCEEDEENETDEESGEDDDNNGDAVLTNADELDEAGGVSEEESEDCDSQDNRRVLVETGDDELEEDPPINDDPEDLPLLPTPRQQLEIDDEEYEGEEPESDLDEPEEGTQEERTSPQAPQEANADSEDGESQPDDAEDDDADDNGEGDGEGGVSKQTTAKKRHVSALQALRYRMRRTRKSKHAFHPIWSAVRLSQHYIIDNIVRIKDQRSWHVQQHNTQKSTKDAFFASMAKSASRRNRRLGIAVTVPRTVVGSPAYLRSKYEDTMAMVGAIGKPDLFLTFTGNRRWPEIERYRKPGYTWADIADIAVRVFFEKFEQLKTLIKGIKKKGEKEAIGIFGKVKGYAYSIELQQRANVSIIGMPHAHVLITLDDEYKLNTPEKVDKVVWAHLPDPDSESDPNKKAELEKLRALVDKHMIHTPCENNPDAYCRKAQKAKKGGCTYKRCEKGYPKEFLSRTTFADDGYVLPARSSRDKGVSKTVDFKTKKTVRATNQHVIPYNPTLIQMFDCHINLEICSTVKSCKYIFKYIMKGFDKALVEFIESSRISNGRMGGVPNLGSVTVGGHVILPRAAVVPRAKKAAMEKDARKRLEESNIPLVDNAGQKTLVYDETIIQSMRSMTAPEALLSAYQIPQAVLDHKVISISVHEPGKETIYWSKGKEDEKMRALQTSSPTSQLTAWFALNIKDELARTLVYSEIPKKYLWSKSQKKWIRRKEPIKIKIIPRVFTVSPRYAERFAIRLLAMNTKGAYSFDELKMREDGTICDSFTMAARERGLMDDEREWEHAMQAAVATEMPKAIRRLFATIVAYCSIKDKQGLFDKFAQEMYDRGGVSDETKRARALYHIESILKNNRLNNEIVGLEKVDMDALNWSGDDRYRHDDSVMVKISPEEAQEKAEEALSKMNVEQRSAFTTLVEAVDPLSTQRCYFLDGPGGTGKTFVYRALYYAFIALGVKVLTVAHTGIAATLLINGTTVHRQFCIPIDANGETKCQVEPDSLLEKTIREAEVIIWDEATMSDRRILGGVDKLLRELEETDPRPFGGKLMLLGGDWKQLLPVVRSTYGPEILDFTIKRSPLWQHFEILRLKKNMRVEEGSTEFAKFLDKVGRAAHPVQQDDGTIEIPAEMCMETEDDVIDWAYGGGVLSTDNCEDIKDTCLLTVLNNAALEINEKVLAMLPGDEFELKSVDKCAKENNYMEFPAEVYNCLTPSGLPPHKLNLKKGCVIVLMRNLNVPRGQCNGTRMRVVDIDPNLLSCEILTDGSFKGDVVLIPRIEMEPQDQKDPTHCFKRLQFPVRLAYAMTVNKAQGQSLKKKDNFKPVIPPLGVFILSPVFIIKELLVLIFSNTKYRRFRAILDMSLFLSAVLVVVYWTWDDVSNEDVAWQLTAIIAFLIWFKLLLMLRKQPQLGIYVIMLEHICKNFLRHVISVGQPHDSTDISRIIIPFSVILGAFSTTFFVLYQNKAEFKSPPWSFLKATTMMIGEFDFNEIFHEGKSDDQDTLFDFVIAFMGAAVFFLFATGIAILLMNLLIGLAVYDVKEIQEKAKLKQHAMLVDLVLDYECNPLVQRFNDRRRYARGFVKADTLNHRGVIFTLYAFLEFFGMDQSRDANSNLQSLQEQQLKRVNQILQTLEKVVKETKEKIDQKLNDLLNIQKMAEVKLEKKMNHLLKLNHDRLLLNNSGSDGFLNATIQALRMIPDVSEVLLQQKKSLVLCNSARQTSYLELLRLLKATGRDSVAELRKLIPDAVTQNGYHPSRKPVQWPNFCAEEQDPTELFTRYLYPIFEDYLKDPVEAPFYYARADDSHFAPLHYRTFEEQLRSIEFNSDYRPPIKCKSCHTYLQGKTTFDGNYAIILISIKYYPDGKQAWVFDRRSLQETIRLPCSDSSRPGFDDRQNGEWRAVAMVQHLDGWPYTKREGSDGHYVCWTRNEIGGWTIHDDDNVRTSDGPVNHWTHEVNMDGITIIIFERVREKEKRFHL